MEEKYTLVEPVVDLRKLVLADLDKAMQPTADAIDKAVLTASSTSSSETPPSPRAHLRGYSAAELTARVERFRAEAADFASRAHALACAGELTPLTPEQLREKASLMQRARYRLREIRALEQRGSVEEAIATLGVRANALRARTDAVDARLAKRMAEALAPTMTPDGKGGMVIEEEGVSGGYMYPPSLTLDSEPNPSLFSRFRRWLTRWTIGP